MSKTDIEAIQNIREQTQRAENAGDADFFKEACSANFVVMPPGIPAVYGPDAAVEFMRDFFRQFDFHIEYVSEETQIHGDIAFDRGTFSHTLTPRAEGESLEEVGKFLWIYSRESDGLWRMARVIWNMS